MTPRGGGYKPEEAEGAGGLVGGVLWYLYGVVVRTDIPRVRTSTKRS